MIVSFIQTHMTDRYMYSTGTLRFLVCKVHHCMMFGTNLATCMYLHVYVYPQHTQYIGVMYTL